jgi:hypothetical protein
MTKEGGIDVAGLLFGSLGPLEVDDLLTIQAKGNFMAEDGVPHFIFEDPRPKTFLVEF